MGAVAQGTGLLMTALGIPGGEVVSGLGEIASEMPSAQDQQQLYGFPMPSSSDDYMADAQKIINQSNQQYQQSLQLLQLQQQVSNQQFLQAMNQLNTPYAQNATRGGYGWCRSQKCYNLSFRSLRAAYEKHEVAKLYL